MELSGIWCVESEYPQRFHEDFEQLRVGGPSLSSFNRVVRVTCKLLDAGKAEVSHVVEVPRSENFVGAEGQLLINGIVEGIVRVEDSYGLDVDEPVCAKETYRGRDSSSRPELIRFGFIHDVCSMLVLYWTP